MLQLVILKCSILDSSTLYSVYCIAVVHCSVSLDSAIVASPLPWAIQGSALHRVLLWDKYRALHWISLQSVALHPVLKHYLHLSILGSDQPLAGRTQVDHWDDTVLMGKLLMPQSPKVQQEKQWHFPYSSDFERLLGHCGTSSKILNIELNWTAKYCIAGISRTVKNVCNCIYCKVWA